MIYATVYKNQKNDIVGFETKGHAGFSEAGTDIVCAAVSMLVINTINSLDKFTDVKMDVLSDEDSARIYMMVTDNYSSEVAVLLKSLELGLTQAALGNPDYISIKCKEV